VELIETAAEDSPIEAKRGRRSNPVRVVITARPTALGPQEDRLSVAAAESPSESVTSETA